MEISKCSSLTAGDDVPVSKFGTSVLMGPNLWFLWCKIFPKDKRSNSSIANIWIMQIMLKLLDCMILKYLVCKTGWFPSLLGHAEVTLLTRVLHIPCWCQTVQPTEWSRRLNALAAMIKRQFFSAGHPWMTSSRNNVPSFLSPEVPEYPKIILSK